MSTNGAYALDFFLPIYRLRGGLKKWTYRHVPQTISVDVRSDRYGQNSLDSIHGYAASFENTQSRSACIVHVGLAHQ